MENIEKRFVDTIFPDRKISVFENMGFIDIIMYDYDTPKNPESLKISLDIETAIDMQNELAEKIKIAAGLELQDRLNQLLKTK